MFLSLKTRKTATTDSKVANEFWTPASPKKDPVKPVRNATIDETNLLAKTLPLALDRTVTVPSVVEAEEAACAADEGVVEAPEVLEDAVEHEGSEISIGNQAMTKRKSICINVR